MLIELSFRERITGFRRKKDSLQEENLLTQPVNQWLSVELLALSEINKNILYPLQFIYLFTDRHWAVSHFGNFE